MENMHSNNPGKLFWQRIVQADCELASETSFSILSRNTLGLWGLISRLLGIQWVFRKQDTIAGTLFLVDIPGTPCWGLSQISVTVL